MEFQSGRQSIQNLQKIFNVLQVLYMNVIRYLKKCVAYIQIKFSHVEFILHEQMQQSIQLTWNWKDWTFMHLRYKKMICKSWDEDYFFVPFYVGFHVLFYFYFYFFIFLGGIGVCILLIGIFGGWGLKYINANMCWKYVNIVKIVNIKLVQLNIICIFKILL